MKKNSYTRSCLIRELAFNMGVTQKKVRVLLNAMQQIAYREAKTQGITIPGICRLDVIQRKSRKMRNPQTGENILIAEHMALRVRALKCARNAVTPPPENLITTLKTENTPDPHILDDFSKAVSFRCKKCGQEIEAPLAAVGMIAECPSCKMQVTIPQMSEPGTLHGPAQPLAPPTTPAPSPAIPTATTTISPPAPFVPPPPTPSTNAPQLKNQTIRIDLADLGFDNTPVASKPLPNKRMLSFFCKNCHQEIEALGEMAGSAAECPSCGMSFEVPFFSDPGTLHGSDLEPKDAKTLQEMKVRTIRIEVPDDL